LSNLGWRRMLSMKREFEAAPEPKEFYPMRGEHNEAIFQAKEVFVNKIDVFLQKYSLSKAAE